MNSVWLADRRLTNYFGLMTSIQKCHTDCICMKIEDAMSKTRLINIQNIHMVVS